MKKILSLLLCIVIILSVIFAMPVAAGAAQVDTAEMSFVTDDKIAYNILPDGTVEFCGYLGDNTRLSIPSEIDGHKVTSIEYRGFEGNITLKQITIPDTVTRIGEYAFYGYRNLEDIVIPPSVEYIGRGAFNMTPWIDAVEDGPVYINNVLYSYFGDMEEGTHFEIREGTVCISDYAFFEEKNLASISIPDTVEYIGVNAFANCMSLKSLYIPASVKSIDSYTFAGAFAIETIVVDDNNPYYDSRENCNAIIETKTNTLVKGCDNTVVPQSVCAIADMAFYHCENLSSVSLSENVTSIGYAAFSSCTGLSEVLIEADSVNIGLHAFNDTPFYNNLPMGENYINNTFLVYKGDIPADSNFALKEGTKSIAAFALAYQLNLVSVELPESLEYIGANAFIGCSYLKNVDVKDNVRQIGDSAFGYCFCLESFRFPAKLEIIGGNAFGDCGNTVFSGDTSNVKSVGVRAFSNCDKLDKIEFSANELSIGEFAFEQCVNLSEVIFNGTVKNIGYNAFFECTALEEIAVDAQRISYDAFSQCTNLKNVYLYNPICNLPYMYRNHTFMGATIHGYENSSAESFCEFYDRDFVSMGKAPVRGDVDGSGELTIIDATCIQLYLAGSSDFDDTQKKNADADKDGNITIMDTTWIQCVLAKLI